MKKYLLIIVLAVLSCTVAKAQKVLHLERYKADNEALAPTDGPRIVLFGDSITDGWASQRPEFFRDHGFLGRGISGEVTAQMLLRFRADVLDIGASTFVLLAGINDIAQNLGDAYNEDATFANMQSMVELAWLNGVRPVICSLLPSYYLRWRPEITDCYEKVCHLNARLQAYCARHGITYVDYAASMADAGGKIREDLSADTVHPNAKGYALMEQILLDALR
jgi:Lysophospholipase L1 and related esterases